MANKGRKFTTLYDEIVTQQKSRSIEINMKLLLLVRIARGRFCMAASH